MPADQEVEGTRFSVQHHHFIQPNIETLSPPGFCRTIEYHHDLETIPVRTRAVFESSRGRKDFEVNSLGAKGKSTGYRGPAVGLLVHQVARAVVMRTN